MAGNNLDITLNFKKIIKFIKIKLKLIKFLEILIYQIKKTLKLVIYQGKKRKLSICIALVGEVHDFLDEQNNCMDITSRRNLQDILKRYAGKKIFILAINYMEEAAFLGNRIGILSE